MSEKTIYRRRAFLNDRKGMAAVEVTLSKNKWTVKKTGEKCWHVDGAINITDCYRHISLDVSVGSGKRSGLPAALRKLNRLVNAISGLRAALVKEAK